MLHEHEDDNGKDPIAEEEAEEEEIHAASCCRLVGLWKYDDVVVVL
jgi:hypothetical protein